MGFLIMIVLGALIGWLASLVTNRDEEQGVLANIAVGIIGAFIGSFVSNALSGRDRSALVFDFGSLFWAFIGAVLLCVLLNLVTRKQVR